MRCFVRDLENWVIDLGLPVTMADLDTALTKTFAEVFGALAVPTHQTHSLAG